MLQQNGSDTKIQRFRNPPAEGWRFYQNISDHLTKGTKLVITAEWARRPNPHSELAGRSARKGGSRSREVQIIGPRAASRPQKWGSNGLQNQAFACPWESPEFFSSQCGGDFVTYLQPTPLFRRNYRLMTASMNRAMQWLTKGSTRLKALTTLALCGVTLLAANWARARIKPLTCLGDVRSPPEAVPLLRPS